MARERVKTDFLRLRIDSELLKLAQERAKKLHMDLSTFVRWCIWTGIVLEDMSAFVRTKMRDES